VYSGHAWLNDQDKGESMSILKFAVLGTGFWSHYQIPAWFKVGGVQLVAVYNRTVEKAEKVAEKFGVPGVYGNPEELFQKETLDFVDIITEVEGHAPLVELAAKYRIPVICQKPMAPDLQTAERMVRVCQQAETPFFIHENWRWQTPIRAFQACLDEGKIGRPFRARITWISAYNHFQNQPSLKLLKNLILMDMGSHLLDISRVLFGEAVSIYCQTNRVNVDLAGEDVATILLRTDRDIAVVIEMAYARAPVERDCFPQTLLFVEGNQGTLELAPDYWLRLTTREGIIAKRTPPPHYVWADLTYNVVHASIVPCNENLLKGIWRTGEAETTGEDNLKTVRLVHAAYESARLKKGIHI
jgi:predicted dehydrogenase